jgi:hypothetical protein
MRATSFVTGAVLAGALAVTRESAAEDSYAAPLFGLTGAFGARSGWGGPDAAILGGGLFAGERWGASGGWRAGVLGDASWWRVDPGVAIDFGGFLSGDAFALWLDPDISVAWFIGGEPMLRWVSSTSRWAVLPAVDTGVRAVGWQLGIVGRPEIGLGSAPDSGSRLGVDVEWKIGVDVIEFARLFQHLSDSHQPLAP